jgi:hypothetical protein
MKKDLTCVKTIQKLLEIKSKVSVFEIASYTARKKSEVLDEIIKNKSLLRFDKNGKIIKFANVRQIQLEDKFENGQVYRVDPINYGADKVLTWNDARAEKLKESYWEGGFGDCREIKVILDTKENRKILEDLGVVEITTAKTDPIESLWKN